MSVVDNTKSILLAVLFIFGSWSLSAQLLNEQDLLLQPADLLNAPPTGNGNDAYIQQIGTENELNLLQNQDDAAATGNLARILQSGDWNVAVITQTEHGNQLALIQNGTLNNYELTNLGFGNNLVNIQDGEGNRIVQQLVNSNQLNIELMQIGNNNEITQFLEGFQGGNYSIRQIGDGLRVIVRQSSF